MRRFFFVIAFFFLIYMVWPGPGQISDFNALPNSDKSDLEGDTIQIPNVAAYFSDNYRDFVVPYYRNMYWAKTLLPFPPLTLNYPPEFSWNVIKRHTDSTYLEEIVYPLRDSLYINGFEQFYEDGSPKFWGSLEFDAHGRKWETKTTLRFFPSSLWVRVVVWLGIVASIIYLHKMGREILKS